MKHNPGFLSADEIIERFIVRGTEFQAVLDVLREPQGPTNQHLLIIGRRGMGKTMLVNRVVTEVQRTPELSERWVPVMFGEEAYNVSTTGELWLEALFHVAEQTGERRWRETHETLLDERDDVRLRNAALARLLDYADEKGGRILLVVENLQDLLGVQMSDDEAWVLRHTLLNEPRIMLLATATNRFDDIDKPKKAAYELFRVLELERLSTDECREVWRQATGEGLAGRAIRPVEIFTGGNLRLVTVLAQFAKGRSFNNFTRELLSLLDDHSDYFKSNIEALPLDERRAFTALCDHWKPALAREVARRARFDVNKTSMLLGRLEQRGAIEVVGKQGRAKLYEVSERLYNLYHLVRRRGARDARMVGLIEFMVRYYGEDRLKTAAEWIAQADDLGDVLEHLGAGHSAVGFAYVAVTAAECACPRLEELSSMWAARVGHESYLTSMLLAVLELSGDALRNFMRGMLDGELSHAATIAAWSCMKIVLEENPDFELTLELDRMIRQEPGLNKHTWPHSIVLGVYTRDLDAALTAVGLNARWLAQVLDSGLLTGALRDAIIELAATRPGEMFDLLSPHSTANPITVALAMDQHQLLNAPREVVEVAKDVLDDIRSRRKTHRYTVPEPQLLAAADKPSKA